MKDRKITNFSDLAEWLKDMEKKENGSNIK